MLDKERVGYNPKEVIIEGMEILEAFDSPLFRKEVLKLSRRLDKKTTSTGRDNWEAGFILYRHFPDRIDSRIIEGKLSEGGTGLGHAATQLAGRYLQEGYCPLVDFHFHPPDSKGELQSLLTPSVEKVSTHEGDLITLREREHILKVHGYDVSVIVAILLRGTNDMLLIQRVDRTGRKADSTLLNNFLFAQKNKEGVIKVLDSVGYKSAYISYDPNEPISTEDALALQSFGFTANIDSGKPLSDYLPILGESVPQELSK